MIPRKTGKTQGTFVLRVTSEKGPTGGWITGSNDKPAGASALTMQALRGVQTRSVPVE
jgi:hypothetical protein